MSQHDRDSGPTRTGAPLFVASCAVGFLIITGCVVYFIAKFFL
jgi:hypothetical protein